MEPKKSVFGFDFNSGQGAKARKGMKRPVAMQTPPDKAHDFREPDDNFGAN